MKRLKNIAVFLLTAAVIILSGGHPSIGMEFMFDDKEYSFEALRAIGASPGGGADINECLLTIKRIREGDDESWYREWRATAERVDSLGDSFLAAGHAESAKEAFFRASNYYRVAEFFIHANPSDARILETARRSRNAFLKAVRLSDGAIRVVEIPFEGKTLPAYFCPADSPATKRPLLIAQTGFDGTAEELYFQLSAAAAKRGYHLLIFEGPGQGMVLREQKILFRPNWETVVTPVVDFALAMPEVDADHIALMGISFGGYLAPRAAAFEKRIKACIANGGVYDFHEVSVRACPKGIEAILDDPAASLELDKDIYEKMKSNSMMRWIFNDGMWKFGAQSPSGWLRSTRPYTMKDCADKITCPTLIIDSEGDMFMSGQAKHLYDALKCPKDFLLFKAEEGAEEHCQIGAMMISNERIFNWLDNTFQKR